MLIALLLVAGFTALYFGAEWLVRGSSDLALRLGLTPLLVGLTVVAYGTSAPELIVSLAAAWHGQGDIALGNAIGSNLVNLGLILGLAALICPLRVQLQLLKIDTPVMVGSALLFLVLFQDHRITRWEAAVFVVLLIVYTALNIRIARSQGNPEVESEFAEALPKSQKSLGVCVVFVLLGLAGLALGARLFVEGATQLAQLMGISEAVIGLTIVAIGTSLPELITSVVAALRGQPDIAVGNLVGSTICNILAIVGFSGVLTSTLTAPGIQMFNVILMAVYCVVVMLIAWTGFRVVRWEGALLLAGYVGYLIWLWPR